MIFYFIIHIQQLLFLLMDALFRPFLSYEYDKIILLAGKVIPSYLRLDQPMGTIVGRTRKDGTTGYLAQIMLKRKEQIVLRESQTFDRKHAVEKMLRKFSPAFSADEWLEPQQSPNP